MIKLAVTGAAGRMGKRILSLAKESGEFEIVAALEYDQCPFLGQDAGENAGIGELGVKLTVEPEVKPDVMIDFSLPQGTEKWVKYCQANKIAHVIGTTGLDDDQKAMLQDAGKDIPVLLGANMSLGVNLLFKLVQDVASRLDEDYDIEIVEFHHRFKRDAPSGTALELGRHAALGREYNWPDCCQHGREGKDALREDKTIGMHAVRAGDIVGEHSVYFSALGETIELRHNAHTRDTFVRGAIKAAKWLSTQKPGYYTMFDVLGL